MLALLRSHITCSLARLCPRPFCFRAQALAIGKLVTPEEDQTQVCQGLADAQFGQGKVHEGQRTLRAAGLLSANCKDVPTSYLRFINNRVQKNAEKG